MTRWPRWSSRYAWHLAGINRIVNDHRQAERQGRREGDARHLVEGFRGNLDTFLQSLEAAREGYRLLDEAVAGPASPAASWSEACRHTVASAADTPDLSMLIERAKDGDQSAVDQLHSVLCSDPPQSVRLTEIARQFEAFLVSMIGDEARAAALLADRAEELGGRAPGHQAGPAEELTLVELELAWLHLRVMRLMCERFRRSEVIGMWREWRRTSQDEFDRLLRAPCGA